MKNSCIDFYTSIVQAQKSFLELIEHELKLINEENLSAVQALIILNIGDNDVSLGDLVLKRGYSGSNASYNIKKIANEGYIEQIPSPHDKRSLILRLTNKGTDVFKKLKSAIDKHSQKLEHVVFDRVNYSRVSKFLREISNYWRNSTNDW